MRYAAHDPPAGLRAAAPSLLPGVGAGLVLWLVLGNPLQAVLVVVVFAGIAGLAGLRAARPVLVDRDGVTLTPVGTGRRLPQRHRVPWAHVLRIEVERTTGTVHVVLRSDAPLPAWVRGRVWDPRDPEAGVRVEQVTAGLDPVALEQAVRAHGPRVEVRRR